MLGKSHIHNLLRIIDLEVEIFIKLEIFFSKWGHHRPVVDFHTVEIIGLFRFKTLNKASENYEQKKFNHGGRILV